MSRPPSHPGESLFAGGTGVHIVWVGLSTVVFWAVKLEKMLKRLAKK